MSTQIKTNFGAFKTSAGGVLVMIGFMTIYFLVGVRRAKEPSIIDYLGIGFGFLIAIAGVILLFKEISKNEEGLSVESAMESSDIEHAVAQLAKNYDILRKQATQGFVLAGTFMAMGILVILAGSIGEMFGFTKTAGNLTTVAGVVIEAVSALGLYLFKETFKRLNTTSDRLHEMWKIMVAFKKAQSLPDENKTKVMVSLIDRLVELPTKKQNG